MDGRDMLRRARAAGVAAAMALAAASKGEDANMMATANPRVILGTSRGAVTIELWPDKAPQTVANFLAYVDAGFYDGLVFHRVIDGFMIQGGGFTPDLRQKPTRAPVRNEARADIPNARGTLAMARTSDVDSATAQFFVNLVDNAFLNHREKTPDGFGYCVFGRVVDGMDAVDAVAKVATCTVGPFENVPAEPVRILQARRATP
jgi:cyclophilin family peptidyl-prolyl cis-trans isomerase